MMPNSLTTGTFVYQTKKAREKMQEFAKEFQETVSDNE
jgi:hypothetical protein